MNERDGIIKKIDLEDGGGSRFCKWDPIDIDFETIHRNLIEIFKLGEHKLKTSLYDFRRNPLDINQYNTFFEYVNKNGLNCSSTIIYLCIHQADDNDNQTIILNKKKERFSANLSSSMSNSLILQQKKSILTETTSLITSVDNKYVNKFQDECNQKQQINQLSTYSFEKSTNDLINTTRNLINQNAFDLILIELFKHICMIRGYVCSIINTLNQQIHHIIQNYQLINQSEIKLYSKSLNEISNICQSVEILINLNKKKFDHIQQFPIIVNLFFEFYENLKILYNNWFEHVEKNNNNNNKYNTLSSSLIRPIESISSNSNIKSSSEYSNEINVENFKEQLQTSSSNKSERLSSTRKLFDDEATTKFLLFRQLLTRFNDLSQLIKKHNLSSYYQMVELTTSQIKDIRSHIDLSNGLSILKAKNDILLIRAEYREKFSHKSIKRNKYKVGQDIKQFYICLMKTIHNVSRRLHRLRTYVDNKKTLSKQPIKVYGQVVNFDTGKPLENAKIDVWQYHPLTGYSVFGYNFRGYFLTDNQGKYEIETLIPVPYVSIRPSHIHVTVSSSGYYKLTTQLYVNPQIKTDFLNHFRPFPQHLILAVEQANKNDDIPQAKFTFRL
ncbi:unnamed protein product [Rotaria sordida]|uniref:Intradiol ring-cleavage dioxygenases domain-containing protein n=1 Tax=Rotaria sordida TaxID=392033 RepID=A0A814WUY1_9BILA|nr:unnamed protein product [Rotaria sordida]CAF1207133.1 unnamed protein product [Rotaria sordida]